MTIFETNQSPGTTLYGTSLFCALQNGVGDAYCQLFYKYRYPLRGYFFARGFLESDVEDLVQTVFVRLFKSRTKLNPSSGTVQSFLFGIAKNIALEARKEARETFLTKALFAKAKQIFSGCHCNKDLYLNELLNDIESCVKKLPQRQRDVFTLVHWEGFPPGLAAAELGINVETLMRTDRRALQRLRKQIRSKRSSDPEIRRYLIKVVNEIKL